VEVFLKDKDRIVVLHTVWNGEKASYTAIAADWNSESYNVLTRGIDVLNPDNTAYADDGGPWTLLWRGDFKNCLEWVEGLMIDMEHDFGNLEFGIKYKYLENRGMVRVETDDHPFQAADGVNNRCGWMVDEDGTICDQPQSQHTK
jgi:hypothetical protein